MLASPQGAGALLVRSVDRLGPPPSSVVVVGSPVTRMKLGACGGEGPAAQYCSAGLGVDGNGYAPRRHLLPGTAFPQAAKVNKALKAHYEWAFAQVILRARLCLGLRYRFVM